MTRNDSQGGLLDEAGFLASVEALEHGLAPGVRRLAPLTPPSIAPNIATPQWTPRQIAALAALMSGGALAAALVFHDKVALILAQYRLFY